MNRSTPGLPVHHQLPEFTQTHVHRVSDAIQPGEGKTTWTGLCSVGDVSVSHLLGTFLARTETPLCVKLHTEHGAQGA